MNQTTIYTPLESLFLFQLLAKYGLVAEAFPRISYDLKQNGLIREQGSYDAERLSPEKLEHLACRLVREEQVREAEAAEKNGNHNGNGAALSPMSRKRKLPSPSLPSLKDLQAQSDKLPQFVDRLYAIYQADIVRRIRADEEAIEKLQAEIHDLEADEATQPVPVSADANIPKSNGAAPVSTRIAPSTSAPIPTAGLKPAQPVPVRPNGHINQPPAHATVSQSQGIGKPMSGVPTPIQQAPLERKPPQPSPSPIPPNVRPPGEVRQPSPGVRSQFSRPPSVGQSGLQHPQAAPAYGHTPGPGTPQPPAEGLQRPPVLPKSQSQSPAPSPSHQLQQPQTPGTYKWEPPFNPQQPPYNGQPIARPPSYPGQPQPGQPQQPHPQHVHPQQPPHPQLPQAQYGNRQTPQPITQPPRTSTPSNAQYPQQGLVPPQGLAPNARQTPPPPRPQYPEAPAQQTQQYRHPAIAVSGPATATPISAPQYTHQQQQFHPAQPGIRQPVISQVHTPSRTYPAVSAAAAATTAAAHRPALAAPAHAGQSSNDQASHAQHSHSLPSTPVAQRQAHQPPNQPQLQNAHTAGNIRQQPRPLAQVNRSLNTAPPVRPASQPQTPLSASAPSHVVRGHGTKWTSTPTPSTPRMELSGYFDPQSPAFEPISPPARPVQLPKTVDGKKETRKNTPKPDGSAPKIPSRLSRSAQKPAQLKESTEDVEINRRIKNEEATPRPFEDADDTTADESVHGKHAGATSRINHKRKRQESPINRGPPTPPTHVLWTRSFQKISASALEQVTSHRHANMFANPIKPRDAPGYPDIILRPQDLRAIRTAINLGQRAAHALEKTLPDLDPNAMNVWLPISIDLIPPKGIINIAQLERELVHMFANSIMYNQDPDRGVGPSFVEDPEDDDDEAVGYAVDENGIVKETRNMFLEVEKLLSDLRSEIERNAQPAMVGRTSVSRGVSVAGGDASNVEDDGDQTGDAEAQSIAKRRRKG